MIMREDEYFGPGLIYYVEGGALVGMRRPRLVRTHALCGLCVSRTGRAPSACGRRNRAELHTQDIRPRMLPPSAAPRRGASCRHPCCSFPYSGLRAHGTLHSPGPGAPGTPEVATDAEDRVEPLSGAGKAQEGAERPWWRRLVGG